MSEEGNLPKGLHILLVEDEPLIAMDGEAILLSLGVEKVTGSRSAADAMQAATTGQFDAAILDLRLGADTSVHVADELRQRGVPVGFLTGYSGEAIPDRYKDCPIATKPFSADGLLRLMQALVNPARPNSENRPA